MCQISSLMAAAEGPVAEFSSFANFEEKKRKSNLLMSFPKTGNQMGSSGQIRKNSFFRFCRPILDIFGFTLLRMESTPRLVNGLFPREALKVNTSADICPTAPLMHAVLAQYLVRSLAAEVGGLIFSWKGISHFWMTGCYLM